MLSFLLLAAWIANYTKPQPLEPSGGLYFFSRVLIPVPGYAQADPQWHTDTLAYGPDTMGSAGCAVTSAAMVFKFYGVDINPQQLNWFLQKSGGFTPEGWLYWEAVAELAPGSIEKAYEDAPSYALIDWNLLHGNPVIIRIRLSRGVTHFVVIVGKQGWDYLIRDPGAGAARGYYPLSELHRKIEALRYYRVLKPVVTNSAPGVTVR
ncbi:MAG: C39 family peptidase [Chthoniobacteraceae bacterium]